MCWVPMKPLGHMVSEISSRGTTKAGDDADDARGGEEEVPTEAMDDMIMSSLKATRMHVGG